MLTKILLQNYGPENLKKKRNCNLLSLLYFQYVQLRSIISVLQLLMAPTQSTLLIYSILLPFYYIYLPRWSFFPLTVFTSPAGPSSLWLYLSPTLVCLLPLYGCIREVISTDFIPNITGCHLVPFDPLSLIKVKVERCIQFAAQVSCYGSL